MTEIKDLAEIRAIVARLKEIQEARKLSDAGLLREYPALGSTRTWRQRCVAENFHDTNVARLLKKLRGVSAQLDGGSPLDTYFPDMDFAVQMTARLGRLECQTNDRRIMVCLAPSGTGKSTWARWAVREKPNTRAYVRIRPTWRNKALHLINGTLRALGKPTTTTNVAEAEHLLILELAGERRTIIFDQAHEGGVALMNEMRVLVDETSSHFVYLAYATAFNRVRTGTTDALIEAKAFLGRCLKPPFDLYQEGIGLKDAAYYLEHMADLEPAIALSVAQQILPAIRANGNLRLLDDAIEAAGIDDGTIDPAALIRELGKKARHEPPLVLKGEE